MPIARRGEHVGVMRRADWLRVLDQAADMGVEMVQFIGGEPTLHPDLATPINHALQGGLEVEVYSDDPAQHEVITRRPSYARTKANIAEALRRRIPLRAGVIDLGDNQRAAAAQLELADLGVPSVGHDRVREAGRGVRDRNASAEELCGRCGDGVAAISPDSEVWPCVFSRWLPVGNVLEGDLPDILAGPEAVPIRAELANAFAGRIISACGPDCWPKNECDPNCNPRCQPNCSPHRQPTCAPRCSPTCDPIRCKPNQCWPRY